MSVWAEEVRPLAGTMTFPVIAGSCRSVPLRTDLRRQLTRAIQRDRPRWRIEDPAQIEVWVSEYAQGRFVAGLRLSDERMRQRGGRVLEREGALRPTVARAMGLLAGEPVAWRSTHAAAREPFFVNCWQLAGRHGVSISTLTPCGPPSGTLLAPLFE